MAATEFLVGAVFSIDVIPAITALESIGRAFEVLDAALQSSVGLTTAAVDKMIGQIDRLAVAWRSAAAEAGRVGRSEEMAAAASGRAGPTRQRAEGLMGPPGRPYWGEGDDWLNANWANRNFESEQRRTRQEAADEDRARMRRHADGPIGPPGRPYWGQGDDWANAEWENHNRDQVFRNQRTLAERENAQVNAARAAENRQSAAMGAAGGSILKGMWPLIGGLAAYSAEDKAMHEEAALRQTLIELGYSPDDKRFPSMIEGLRGKLIEGTLGTIYSESHGSGAMPGTAGQFGSSMKTPEERLRKYEEVLPGALKFGEVAEQYHRGSLTESTKAAFSYANMTMPKNKEEFGHSLDTLMAIALSTGNTVAGEQNTMKYSLPIGMAAGMAPDRVAAITGFFEMMGMSGTTAGTGVGQLLMGLAKTGGPMAAQQEANLSREFTAALHLDPSEIHKVHKSRGSEHTQAMKDLGLYDETGAVAKDVNPGGKFNDEAFFGHISEYLSHVDPLKGMATLATAFTVRGSREADMFNNPDMLPKLKTYIENTLHPKSIDTLQKELTTSSLQQFEQMLANIANIGNTLATTTLGPLNTAFQTLNTALIGVNNWLKGHEKVSEGLGWGSLALAGAAGVGVAASAGKWLWRNTGARALWGAGRGILTGGGAAEAGADLLGADLLGGGGAGAGAAGMTVAGVALPLTIGGVLAGGYAAGRMNSPMVDDYGRQVGTWGGRPNGSPAQISVNLGPVTMHGVPDDSSLRALLAKLTDYLKSGLSTSTSSPHGTDMTPYTYGGF